MLRIEEKQRRIILVTGFEAFGEFRSNPTEKLIAYIEGANYSTPEYRILARTLSVEYDKSETEIRRLIVEHGPQIILSFGVALRAETLSIERLAVNIDDAPLPDNAGEKRSGMQIKKDGLASYLSTLSIELIHTKAMQAGLTARISDSAGGFICNHLFYCLRYMAEQMGRPFINGFFHVPPLKEDARSMGAAIPGCEFADLVKAFEVILEVVGR